MKLISPTEGAHAGPSRPAQFAVNNVRMEVAAETEAALGATILTPYASTMELGSPYARTR